MGGHGRADGWHARVPRAFAGVLTGLAALCALASIFDAIRAGSQPFREFIDVLVAPAPANLAYAAFVGVLAAAVARRKRIAWWILIAYLGLELVATLATLGAVTVAGLGEIAEESRSVLRRPEQLVTVTAVSAAIAAGALVVLVLARREFMARVQQASVLKAAGVFVGLALAFVLLGWALVGAVPGTVRHGDRLAYAAQHVLGGTVAPATGPGEDAPGWVKLLLGLFGAIALLAALFTLFRSQRAAATLDAADERRIRDLLAQHGERDSLGYFATRRDKSVIFSPTGKAAVTYRVVIGVCIASGDPVGDPEAWGPAISAWLRQAREYGWSTAVMGAGEAGATAYNRAGLRVLELGDEAVLQVREFTLEGREMRPVRQAVRRIERAGYTTRIRRHADVPVAEMATVVRLADAWRDTEAERGFSMALSRLGDPADGDCVLVEVLAPGGEPVSVLSFAPWGSAGLSLDLMRRRRDAENGLMEFAVAHLVAAAPGLGVERISLNFAVFRSAFEEGARIGAGPVLRAWRGLLLFLSRWWQLESLYRSNVKYRPTWVPRYVCFAERRELAKVGLAAAIAEGFLVLPWPRRPSVAAGPAAETPPAVQAAPAGTPEAPPPWHGARAPTAADAAGAGTDVAATGDVHGRTPAVTALPPAGRGSVPEQVAVRLGKLDRLRAAGVEPYPVGVSRTDECAEVRARFGGLAPDARSGEHVTVAGRVMLIRDHGGLTFVTLRDWSGDLQVMITAGPGLDRWGADVDLGDHVAVHGEVIATRRGEITVLADDWTLTAKCLHPLPDKHRGLADAESRVRHRHLDLIVNPGSRDLLRARSAAVQALRDNLHGRGFLEVETPILQPVHGGANARPFVTHSNAYDLRLYLRIAPELYLKRLCVGGVEKVFELGRTFRNEGVSVKHNPEFTMLEAYQAYGDYTTMRHLARDLIVAACRAATGGTVIRGGDVETDLAHPWPVVPVYTAVSAALGEPVVPGDEPARLRKLADAARVPYDPAWGHGALVLELYERLVEHATAGPTFYTDFPTDVSPLTRAHRDDPRLAERWDLVAHGMELGTAYSELTDPLEQRRRLTEQSLLAAGGDSEAMELDEDFLATLEYAMPPCGGLGLGVDRLIMLFTGRGIRETLPFPLVRPAGPDTAG